MSGTKPPAVRPNAAPAEFVIQPPGVRLAQPPMKKFVPYLITAAIAIVAVKVLYPMVQPYAAKLPLVGSFFTA